MTLGDLNRSRALLVIILNAIDPKAKFLHSYADVIDDCALEIQDPTTVLQYIDHVSVHLDKAEQPLETEYGREELFRIRWMTHGKDGNTGSHSVYRFLVLGRGMHIFLDALIQKNTVTLHRNQSGDVRVQISSALVSLPE